MKQVEIKKALKILEIMSEDKFQEFFKSLPYRTQLCCQGGLVDWKKVLPTWYIKKINKG